MARKDYKTVEECLKAGYTWEQCVGVSGFDKAGNVEVKIKKKCPVPMKRELKRKIIDGAGTIYKDEE